MRHLHLGAREGTVLAFGGPYSNLQAMQALVAQGQARGIASDHLICTGDVVAYCADPAATVAAVRATGCVVVAGNCEQQLAAGAMDCGCGFEEGSTCDVLSAGWFAHADAHVGAADRAWMAALPDVVTFDHHGARYAVLHGGATDVARFVWAQSDRAVFAEEWAHLERAVGPVDHVIAGHCGVPFVKETAQGTWINAGVIGMPPHNGHGSTRFCVLDQGVPQICALEYDAKAAAAAMHDVGLTQGYDAGLLTGYWPSEDVLPLDLRVPLPARG